MSKKNRLAKLQDKEEERKPSFEKRVGVINNLDKRDLGSSESSEILNKIVIDNDLSDRFQRLEDQEKHRLYLDILEKGFKDPLEYAKWDNKYILLDGHNRYDIYKEHSKELQEPALREVTGFKKWDDLKEYADRKQFLRRNIKSSEKAYFFGRKYKELQETQKGAVVKRDMATYLEEEFGISKSALKEYGSIYEGIELLREYANTSQVARDLLVNGFNEINRSQLKALRKKRQLIESIDEEIKTQKELNVYFIQSSSNKKKTVSPLEKEYKSIIKINASKFKKDPKSEIKDTIQRLENLLEKY